MKKKEKIKIAILGIGHWGKNLVREFLKVSDIKYCLHSGNKENGIWLKDNYPGIKSAESYEEILNDKDVKAVVIATPIETHFELARNAILAGKNVFVEKPLSATLRQAKGLNSLAGKKKVALFTGHILIYDEIFERLKKIALKEPIKSLYFAWEKFGSFDEPIALNLWCHDVSIALALAGNSKMTKHKIKSYFESNTGNILIAQGKFGKIDSFFYINRISMDKNKSIIIQTEKNIYNWTNNSLYKLDQKRGIAKWQQVLKPKSTPLEKECRAFIEAVSRNKPYPTDGKFGIEVLAVIESAGS